MRCRTVRPWWRVMNAHDKEALKLGAIVLAPFIIFIMWALRIWPF